MKKSNLCVPVQLHMEFFFLISPSKPIFSSCNYSKAYCGALSLDQGIQEWLEENKIFKTYSNLYI